MSAATAASTRQQVAARRAPWEASGSGGDRDQTADLTGAVVKQGEDPTGAALAAEHRVRGVH